MKSNENSAGGFFDLIKTGLWEDSVKFKGERLKFTEGLDWEMVYQLAAEQSVVGLVLAGIERSIVKPPQELLL